MSKSENEANRKRLMAKHATLTKLYQDMAIHLRSESEPYARAVYLKDSNDVLSEALLTFEQILSTITASLSAKE